MKLWRCLIKLNQMAMNLLRNNELKFKGLFFENKLYKWYNISL